MSLLLKLPVQDVTEILLDDVADIRQRPVAVLQIGKCVLDHVRVRRADFLVLDK